VMARDSIRTSLVGNLAHDGSSAFAGQRFFVCCPVGRRRSFNPGSSPTSCICRLLARSPSCPSSSFASGHIVLMLGGLSGFWSNTTTNALRICLVVACLSGGAAISTCLSGPDLIFAPAPVTSRTR